MAEIGTKTLDAVILGGGAAGLMCALEAGKRGRRVCVLEKSEKIGKKILISGGGRCNFTNLYCSAENFISANPHFAKSALARYTPADFLSLVEKHGIPYHEKKLGQLFCDRSARDITGMLEAECRTAGVDVVPSAQITTIRQASDGGFVVCTQASEFRSPTLVVATGGLTIPKIGATPFGYELARQFGLKIRLARPALVPLLFSAEDRRRFADLAGVSCEASVNCGGQQFREKLLFTHQGLSGPAILQISSYWTAPDAVCIDLAPGCDLAKAMTRDLPAVRAELREVLPNRVADRWLELYPPVAFTNKALADFDRQLHSWKVMPAGTEGYSKAEVTAGGVDTDELTPQTMESRKVPGLYFVGEVVDVTGQLGGFNFQWAWASGACAGRSL
jgi:predicted Rossmann fold flavoprotein